MALKVGIVSANWGAFAHLPAWRSLPEVEVTGICTSRRETAEAAAEKFGIARAFWDAEAMCADPDIDIVDLGTRPSLRHAMVLAALRHGKHVYNGIPFAADIDQARDMHRAWQVAGTVAIVDAYSQWLGPLQLLRERIGQLGQMFGGTCHFNMSLFNRPHPLFPYNWFHQAGLGVSAVRNLGSHALHMLVHLFGPIEEVVAHDTIVLKEWVFPDGDRIVPETNDFANALLRFASGMTLQFQISWSAPLGEGFLLDVFGSNGRAVVSAPSFPTSRDTALRIGMLGGVLEEVPIPENLQRCDGVGLDWDSQPPPSYPMAVSMRAMVDAIEGRGTAAPDFEQAWQVERVQEAMRRSNIERRWIRVDEIG